MMYRKDEIKMNRERSGIKVGALGAAGNIVLFIIKFIMGSMANSIAIIADSFNNLVDCTSSVITIAGFHISGKGRDEKHPFDTRCGVFTRTPFLQPPSAS